MFPDCVVHNNRLWKATCSLSLQNKYNCRFLHLQFVLMAQCSHIAELCILRDAVPELLLHMHKYFNSAFSFMSNAHQTNNLDHCNSVLRSSQIGIDVERNQFLLDAITCQSVYAHRAETINVCKNTFALLYIIVQFICILQFHLVNFLCKYGLTRGSS